MLLVQLMDELKMDVGPESQIITLTLPTYDTFAYVVTTFAVNGYEVKLSEVPNPISGTKYVFGKVEDDGWRIDLFVYNVPLTEGEATTEADGNIGGPPPNRPRPADEQEGPVPGRRVRRRTGKAPGKPADPPGKGKKPTQDHYGNVTGGSA